MRRAVVVAVILASGRTLSSQQIEVPPVPGGRLPVVLRRFLDAPSHAASWQSGWAVRVAQAQRGGQPVTGQLPIVVVPALFSDSPDPLFTPEDIARVYFTGPYANGTMNEYYTEVSGGRLALAGDVRPWVRTNLKRADVLGAEWGLGSDAKMGLYLADALTQTDPTTDFSQFDSDGPDGIPNSGDDDGVVDVVAFEFIEIAASCGGPGIWPHRSSLRGWNGEPFVTNDTTPAGVAIEVNGYIVQSTVTCSGDQIHTSGVMAHELGHVLGLPDYRHHVGGVTPENRRWLVGCFDLMSAGSWGCDDVPAAAWVNATHMSPFPKLQLGWISKLIEAPIGERVEVTLNPVQTSEEVLRIPLGGTEHLLLEYRPAIGFDRILPGSGVLIYRVNTAFSPAPCSSCDPDYGLYLEEADGRQDLRKTPLEGGNRGTAADIFARSGVGTMTNATVPSTRLMNGDRTVVNIYEVRVTNGQAKIVFSTASLALDRLLQPLLRTDGDTLATVERQFLDSAGNGNGRYDVGDLRAYLKP